MPMNSGTHTAYTRQVDDAASIRTHQVKRILDQGSTIFLRCSCFDHEEPDFSTKSVRIQQIFRNLPSLIFQDVDSFLEPSLFK